MSSKEATPPTDETRALMARLKDRTQILAGGCLMLSLGDQCTCPQCDLNRIEALLRAHQEERETIRQVLNGDLKIASERVLTLELELRAKDAASAPLLTYVQHMAARELCEDDPKVEACYTESGPDCGAHGPPDPAVKEARRLVAALEGTDRPADRDNLPETQGVCRACGWRGYLNLKGYPRQHVDRRISGESPRVLTMDERLAALPEMTDTYLAQEAKRLMHQEVCEECGRQRVDSGTRCYCGAKWAEMVRADV